MKEKHINDVQTSTVDEHLKLILKDDSINDTQEDVTSNNLPHWYDEHLYKKAQNFYNQNLFSITVAHFVGVITIFSITPILKVLLYTKQSSIPCAAAKRYIQTQLHIHNIYISDANKTDSKWYKSINVIRWKHKTNSEKSKNAGVGPIYQRDMVLTQLCFVAYLIMMPECFGIRDELMEYKAFIHFWRVVGHMLGIPDRLNLCRKTAAETRELCQKIIKTVFVNSLNQVSSDFDDTVSTVINSLWYVDLDLNKDYLLTLAYRIHGIEYKKPVGWYSWLIIKYNDFVIKLCLIPYVGRVIKMCLNKYFAFKLFLTKNFPMLAWIKYGRDFRINLYPKYK